MIPRGVIFDLDGTLLDTLDDIRAVVNEILSEEGLDTHDRETYRLEVGRGLENLLRRLLQRQREEAPDERVDALAARVRSLYLMEGDRRTRPYEGIGEVLDRLSERSVPVAVLSNKPNDSAVAAVRRFFPHHPFSCIRGAEPGSVPKPAPDAALEIAAGCLGCAPREVAFVGDTAVDMRTAVAAGMLPVGVLWGFRDSAELESGGAAVLVGRPPELIGVLLGGER
ncbi:HAD family hydrolase [Candidatus Fermentibacterales bacterium]|nr:HAD family hydrolase [Candidatus Fermentibacterales bacterium]